MTTLGAMNLNGEVATLQKLAARLDLLGLTWLTAGLDLEPLAVLIWDP